MSGYWDSSVIYSRRAAAILSCGKTLRQTADAAVGIARASAAVGSRAHRGPVASDEIRCRVESFVRELSEISSRSERILVHVKAQVLPERPADTTDEALSGLKASADRLASEAAQLASRVEVVSAELIALEESDAVAAQVRAAARRAADEIVRSRDLLERWSPKLSDELSAEADELVSQVDSALREQGDAREFLEAIVSRDAAGLQEKVEREIAAAEDLQDRQARRVYVLKALRSVCGDLGFQECEAPKYEGGDRRKGLVVSFDTRGKGIVSFRLTLDAHIETDSGMDHRYCASDFGMLSEALDSEFGMQAQFTDLGDDERPIGKTFRADELPKRSSSSVSEP